MHEDCAENKNSVVLLPALGFSLPPGTRPEVLGRFADECCVPCLRSLKKHPAVKLGLFINGVVWDWFEFNNRDVIRLVAELVAGGQVELIGGGYYSPALCAVPERDAIGQINKLSSYLVQRFDTVVKGLWLEQMVWEPSVVCIGAKSGLSYTLLDESHFRRAGFDSEEVGGYYLTEYNGYSTGVFASSDVLMELFCADDERALARHLMKRRGVGRENALCVVFDASRLMAEHNMDAVERMFDFAEKNVLWFECMKFGDFMETVQARGLVYVPQGAGPVAEKANGMVVFGPEYEEIYQRVENLFGRIRAGGCVASAGWRSFFSAFAQSGNMHKKMLQISEAVWAHAGADAQALDLLWQAQAADAFWPALWGGVFDPALRKNVYRGLLGAEMIADSCEQIRRDWARCVEDDFDCDGKREILFSSCAVNMYFKPERGGSVFELDYKPAGINICDVPSAKLSAQGNEKEFGQLSLFGHDSRACFADHLLDPQVSADDFRAGRLKHCCGNFASAPYHADIGRHNDLPVVKFKGTGLRPDGRVFVDKSFCLTDFRKIVATYKVHSKDVAQDFEGRFGVEFAFALPDPEECDMNFELTPAHEGDAQNVAHRKSSFKITDQDSGFYVHLKTTAPADIWYFPVETKTPSGVLCDRYYQGLSVFVSWPVILGADRTFEFIITLDMFQSQSGLAPVQD